MIRENNVVFLLGAGCSYEAGIPLSNKMVENIEALLIDEKYSEWGYFRDLYNYLKSSIAYADGIFGEFNKPFNVEKLLVVMTEIEKKDRNTIYPFIGTWNNHLLELAGKNFSKITEFKRMIVAKLNDWVKLKDFTKAEYYSGFLKFQNEIGSPLRIFSLNYDLCFERMIAKDGILVEDGFDPATKIWDYNNFILGDNSKHIYLYKLHGSINWYIENSETFEIKKSDEPENTPELIFGIESKMQSNDPYLFYIYQFRDFTLKPECKLLVLIGYSYSDDYINRIVRQALIRNNETKILSVTKCTDKEVDDERNRIIKSLSLNNQSTSNLCERIEIYNKGAAVFLKDDLNQSYLSTKIQEEDDVAPF